MAQTLGGRRVRIAAGEAVGAAGRQRLQLDDRGTVSDRGRGLGLAVKVEALRRAKEAGVSEVRTNNHERNAPMLAVNRRLGYRTLPAIVWLVRDV